MNDTRPVIVVHSLAHARAALAAARSARRPVTLLSAPGAARAAGPGWWRALVEAADAAEPGADAVWVLDCADEPGSALAALREGVTRIALSCPEPAFGRVREIAAKRGAAIAEPDRSTALDLALSADPEADCAAFVSGNAPGVAKPSALR